MTFGGLLAEMKRASADADELTAAAAYCGEPELKRRRDIGHEMVLWPSMPAKPPRH